MKSLDTTSWVCRWVFLDTATRNPKSSGARKEMVLGGTASGCLLTCGGQCQQVGDARDTSQKTQGFFGSTGSDSV
eukprot:m.863502 g.863502  ORF g.863502 m.863502 type:complete len:75 (-) comp23543_c1_seq8:111-335(-)